MKKLKKTILIILSAMCVYTATCNLNVSADSSVLFYYFDDYNYLVYSVSDGKATITSCMCGGDIAIPEEIEGYPVATIGYRAFHLSEMITSVSLPDNLIRIEEEAFAGCKLLKSLVIPQNVQSIGNYAIGFDFVATTVSVGEKYSDFTLSGFENTIAETYAIENGFTFIALDEPISTTTTQVNPMTTSTSTTESDTTTHTSPQNITNSITGTMLNQTTAITQKIDSVSGRNTTISSKSNSTSSPKTGDTAPIAGVLNALGVSTISAILFIKKRR